ncbi:hypothetical protein [Cohnella cellulosilytica]|uniref:Uncharacterized protein n=1 Tax=Cohnella cellulosilytica TaxID=986710 RepID=A0ABW2FJM2_9BACL
MKPYDFYLSPEDYEVAAINGISRQTLDARIRRHGWDKARAITIPCQRRTDRGPWRRVAAANGIADSTFQARISIHGWDPEEAATTPPHPRPYELAAIKNRKIPREIYELAVANGISESTFRSRIYESGWDVRRAATEPLWTHEQVCAYGNARIKKKYGDNPMGHLFPHREKR